MKDLKVNVSGKICHQVLNKIRNQADPLITNQVMNLVLDQVSEQIYQVSDLVCNQIVKSEIFLLGY